MLLEHDVANFKDDAGLRAFVSSVQQAATLFHRAALPRAPPSIPASVTLTVTNFAYSSGFDNWLTFTRAALTLPVVAAMDRASYDYFVSRGECALLLRDSAKLPFNRRSLYIKSELSARLLGAQLKLIFSEMDVFWSEDPHLIEDLPVGSAGLLNTSASGGKCAAGMFTFGKPGSGDATVVDGSRPPPTELLNMFNRSSPPPPPPFVCCPGERSREADGTQIDTLHVHSAGLKKVNGRYRRVSTGTHPTFENDRGCSIKYATLGSGGCTMVAYSGWGIACDHHHRYATSGCADDLPTTCSWRPRRGHANPPAPCVCRGDQEVTVGKGMRVG